MIKLSYQRGFLTAFHHEDDDDVDSGDDGDFDSFFLSRHISNN